MDIHNSTWIEKFSQMNIPVLYEFILNFEIAAFFF